MDVTKDELLPLIMPDDRTGRALSRFPLPAGQDRKDRRRWKGTFTMTGISGFDHIAIAVPNLPQQVDRLKTLMGLVVQFESDKYALVADPSSGFKIELTESTDTDAHFRHLGFRADDVTIAHQSLVEAGMTSTVAPERRDFARMTTAFLTEQNGLEVQLVKYD
jgi:hypothetical protein